MSGARRARDACYACTAMGDPAHERPSFDELYAAVARLAPGMTGEILEPGVLRVMSRPGRGPRKAHKALVDALRGRDADRGGRGWWIEIEPEIRLDDLLVVPDLAGWRVERVPELPDDNPLTIVPDWTCDVLSPSTERDDRRLKLPLYARCGVGHVWLVDPDQRLVEVFETRGGLPTLLETAIDDDRCSLEPFGGDCIQLGALWLPRRAAPET